MNGPLKPEYLIVSSNLLNGVRWDSVPFDGLDGLVVSITRIPTFLTLNVPCGSLIFEHPEYECSDDFTTKGSQ